jgi:hypothetical protein
MSRRWKIVLFVGLFLSMTYNVSFMLRDDPEPEPDAGLAPLFEMDYAILEMDGRQVVLDGHCNSVSREDIQKYIEERDVPDGAGVILDVRRGRIIKMEVKDGDEEGEEDEEGESDDSAGDGPL